MNTRNSQLGVNLIELMIVVAIVGIIAAIAYPSYLEQIRSTKRADCSGALVGLANAMERHYSVNGSYLAAGASGGNTGAPTIFPASCPLDGGTAEYNLIIQAATTSTYALRAVPTGGQATDKCGKLTLGNTGVKGVVDAHTGVTWDACW